VRSLLAFVAASDTTGADGSAKPPIELLRKRYDIGSEAYLNGAICRIEYGHIIEQINQMLSALVAPEMRDTVNTGEMSAPLPGRKRTAAAKGRNGKGKSGPDAKSDVGFAAIVQRTHTRLAGRDRSADGMAPRAC
jgi:hypothetical protein